MIRFLALLAAWTRAFVSIIGKGSECIPWSKVKPPKAQPWVPLRRARIGFENPHWRNVSAPMIERVRPAQFMTNVVSGSIARAGIRYANSALGQERAEGIDILKYSCFGRPSKTTVGSSRSNLSCNSSAEMDGVMHSCSTSSPNVFDGTFTPLNSV